MIRFRKQFLTIPILTFFLLFTILSAFSLTIHADSSGEDGAYSDAKQTIASQIDTKEKAVFGTEWQILDLARDDQEVTPYYLKNLIDTIIANDGVLHTGVGNYTNYAKAVLALTSLGVDPTNIAGYNLIQPVSDVTQVQRQGVNGVIYALLALDCHQYNIEAPEGLPFQVDRDYYINLILKSQLSDGGWDWADKQADPDMTAMAIQALAPYYDSNDRVKAAVDTALQTLSDLQQSDGGFQTEDAQYQEASESTSMVIIALTALGIDPTKDDRFIKNGFTTIDNLVSFATGGGFKHTADGTFDAMATDQGYRALTAFHRLQAGKTAFYDMTDIQDLLVIETALSEKVLIAEIDDASAVEEDVALINNSDVLLRIDGKIESLFDLQFVLTDESGSVCFPISESDTPQTITITIPEDKLAELGDNVLIIGVHDGEVFSITPDSVDKATGEVTFKASQFSTYAAVSGTAKEATPSEDETEPDTPVTPAKTGDNTNITIWILLMTACVLIISLISWIHIRTQKKSNR